MSMKGYLLSCTAILALAACASHPPHCGSRMTPINLQSLRAEPGLRPHPRAVPSRKGRT